MTKLPSEAMPCRECNSPCRVEHFEGPHIQGRVSLWLCSNHKRFGGDCPSDLAYFTEEAWNTRTLPPPAETGDDDAEWLLAWAEMGRSQVYPRITPSDQRRLEAIASRLSSAGDDELVARLTKLSRDATKGEWFTESEDIETSHGRVMTLSIFADGEKSWQDVPLFQATAEAMVVECDDDYDAPRLFDRTSFANAEFAVACVNYVRTLLATRLEALSRTGRE